MISGLTQGATALLGMSPLGVESASLRGRAPREVAREFEAMLLAQMIAAMRKTVPESGLLGASAHRQVFDGVFDLELARVLGGDNGLGLADVLTRQLGLETREPAAPGRDLPSGAERFPATAQAQRLLTPVDPHRRLFSEPSGDALALPVAGRISSGFGPRIHPMTGREHFHGGIDVEAPRGSAVASPRAGEVIEVGSGASAGRFVRVRSDDGTVATYAHLDAVRVRAGDRVAPGALLGTVGMTGRATGPHLHLAVHRDGTAIDPTHWLGQPEERRG